VHAKSSAYLAIWKPYNAWRRKISVRDRFGSL